MVAEMQGAAGVVINAPAPAETIETTMSMVDIPVIATVTEDDEITECKILAGAAIINVAAGARTAQVVASIRAHHPEITDPGIGRRIRRSHPRHHRSGRGCHHMERRQARNSCNRR